MRPPGDSRTHCMHPTVPWGGGHRRRKWKEPVPSSALREGHMPTMRQGQRGGLCQSQKGDVPRGMIPAQRDPEAVPGGPEGPGGWLTKQGKVQPLGPRSVSSHRQGCSAGGSACPGPAQWWGLGAQGRTPRPRPAALAPPGAESCLSHCRWWTLFLCPSLLKNSGLSQGFSCS